MNKLVLAFVTIAMSITGSVLAFGDIEYQVQKGDTLRTIAKEYGLTYQEIGKYNQMLNPNRIYVDQILLIPVAEEKETQMKAGTPDFIPEEDRQTEEAKEVKWFESSAFLKYEAKLPVKEIEEKGSKKELSERLMQKMKDLKLKQIKKTEDNQEGINPCIYGDLEGKKEEIIYFMADYSLEEQQSNAFIALNMLQAMRESNYMPDKTIRLFLYEGNGLEQLSLAFPQWQENCFAVLDLNSLTNDEKQYELELSCDLNAIGQELAQWAKDKGYSVKISTPDEKEVSVAYLKAGVPAAAQWISEAEEKSKYIKKEKEEYLFIQKALGKLLLDIDSMAVKPMNLNGRMKLAGFGNDTEEAKIIQEASEELNRKIKSMNLVSIAALAEGDIVKAEKIKMEAESVSKEAQELNKKYWDKKQIDEEKKK